MFEQQQAPGADVDGLARAPETERDIERGGGNDGDGDQERT